MQSQILSEIEPQVDISQLMSLFRIASDTYNRYRLETPEFSLFLSALNIGSGNTTIISQGLDSSTKSKFKSVDKSGFIYKHKNTFTRVLKVYNIENDGDSEAERYFDSLLVEDRDGAIKLLEELFTSTLISVNLDEALQIGILKLLCNYDFNELGPSAQLIATSAYSIKSIRVKSATFDLFGHWANKEAYNMLKKYDEPKEPWLRMKYKALIKSMETRYAIH